MRCRTLAAPAPWAAGTTGPPVATPCDASPDLGLLCCWQPRARARSSPHRPPHATPATNSLSTLDSLQLLPWPARREAGEPLGDTHTRLRCSGSPQNLHRGGKHDSGGRLPRRRNATRGNATERRRNGTLDYRRRHNRTRTQRLQRRRNDTHGDAAELGDTTRIQGYARPLSNAGNTRGGETLDSGSECDHAFVSCGQARNRLTRNQNLAWTLEGHCNPPDVLFAFRH